VGPQLGEIQLQLASNVGRLKGPEG